MDPFGYGVYDYGHNPKTYFASGGGYRRRQDPFYYEGRRGGEDGATSFIMNRRFRRRLRFWLIVLTIIAGLGGVIYWKVFRQMDSLRGRMNEVWLESLINDVVKGRAAPGEISAPANMVTSLATGSTSISKPDIISPPAEVPVMPVLGSVIEKDGPPTVNNMDVTLDEPGEIGARSLAKQQVSNKEEKKRQIHDLEQLLELENSPLRKLTSQVEELGKKLASQSQVMDSLQKKLAEDHIKPGGISTLGQEIMKELGVQSKEMPIPKVRAKPEQEPGKASFYTLSTFIHPPASTVLCTGTNSTNRVCKFKNLCYDANRDVFFIFKDTASLEVNIPTNRSYLVDTTSIDGHNKFYFDYNEVNPRQFQGQQVLLVEKLTFMLSRFHALNIMHTMHDDFFGLYALHRMFAPNNDEDDRYSFSRDNHLFFLDGYESIRYDYMFQFISDNPLQFRGKLKRELTATGQRQPPVCFRDAVVGNSKIGSWYSYGFLEPQGPILNKTVSGLFVRDVATFLMNRMSIPLWDERAIRGALQDLYLRKLSADQRGGTLPRVPRGELAKQTTFIAFFSRQIDRLIVNEAELVRTLEETYGLPVKMVRMEDMHLGQQAAILRSSVLAIGMHGSALILSMFLPPGAILIELFPYAVPADNYTPYKTLCRLPGMRLTYRSWTNKKAENNIPHPERPPAGGGIAHLPIAEQDRIKNLLTVPPHLCCADPVWLYRIYQDTRVDLPSLLGTINSALKDALASLDFDPQALIHIRPAVIDQVQCSVVVPANTPTPYTNQTKLDLEIRWDAPWNGVVPDRYGVWIHQPYKEFLTEQNSLQLPGCNYGSRYDIWVRSYVNRPEFAEPIRSQYSEKVTCYCKPDTVAKRTDPTDL